LKPHARYRKQKDLRRWPDLSPDECYTSPESKGSADEQSRFSESRPTPECASHGQRRRTKDFIIVSPCIPFIGASRQNVPALIVAAVLFYRASMNWREIRKSYKYLVAFGRSSTC
jgi:hypothetical protein